MGRVIFGASHIAALVLVVEPAGLTRIDPALLEATLSLTPTESQVAFFIGGRQDPCVTSPR